MAYQLFTPTGSAHATTPITVPDNAIDVALFDSTNNVGVQLVGRNSIDYGTAVAQNTVQMVTNFAGTVLPSDSIALQGQLWFNALSATTGNLYVRQTSNPTGGLANWQQIAYSSGNVATASKLQTARNIAATGDATWSVSFDGSADVTSPITLATVTSPVAISFQKVAVNAKGLVVTTSGVVNADIVSALGYTPVNQAGDTMTGTLTMSGGAATVTGLPIPVAGSDAVNKSYVDSKVQGLSFKQTVRVGTTIGGGNITLSGLQTIDAIAVAINDRVLVKNQSLTSENGIYNAQVGAWTRSNDADTGAELVGAYVFVDEGTVNAATSWAQTTAAPITIGTTPLVWSQLTGATNLIGGPGISVAGNTISNTGVLSVNNGSNISVSSTTGNSVISVVGTVPSATVASTVTATPNGANTNYPVAFLSTPSGSASVLTGGLTYNPSTNVLSGAVAATTAYWCYDNTAQITPPNSGIVNYQSTITSPIGISSYSAGTVTVTNTGVYTMTGTVSVGYNGGAGAAACTVELYRNGSATGITNRWTEANNTSEYSTITVNGVLSLNAGDTVSVHFSNGFLSGNLNTFVISGFGSWSGYRIA